MRIVNYHPRARVGDGGITNSVRSLSEAFARVGAEPVIVYDGRGRPYREAGVQWWPLQHRGAGPLRVPFRADAVLRSADVLVLNSAWTSANVRMGRAARRVNTPYVLAPRGAYDPLILGRRRRTKRLWWLAFERRLVLSASAMHVFFADQAADVEAFGFHGDLVVAPNGVHVPAGRRWDGGSGGYVVYVGRFDPHHKGLDLLLRAMALLPASDRPSLRLHGPDWAGGKAQVEALVVELDLGAHVDVGAAVYGDEKWDVLERATGLVYPSRWEGFGNSLAEAAALGLPTLATPYPLARFLASRQACLVVQADPGALATGLSRLTEPGMGAMGLRAREAVEQEFGWDAVARQWMRRLTELAL